MLKTKLIVIKRQGGRMKVYGATGTGKSFLRPNTLYVRHISGSPQSFILSDPKNEFGFLEARERYQSMSVEGRQAEYASNNWRRLHGYPLRRDVVNKAYKNRDPIERMWWKYFDRYEVQVIEHMNK